MKRRLAIAIGTWLVLAATAVPAGAAAGRPGPVDSDAGASVRALLANLQDAGDPRVDGGFLFGQQHANWDSKREQWLGGDWRDWNASRARLDELNTFPSDIELAASLFDETPGNKPAVYGFNLRLALRVSDVQRKAYARQIVAAYSTGTLVTIHFPAENPAIGGSHNTVGGNPMCALSNDWQNPPEESAETIGNWMSDLEEASRFFDEVNRQWRDPDSDGQNERNGNVAIVFRPFHEMTGISHWWAGRFYRSDPRLCNRTAPQAFRTVWRRTVDYLTADDDPATEITEGLGRHDLLFAWSPGRPTLTTDWRKYHPNMRLPGRWRLTDYVDIVGLDIYGTSLGSFKRQLIRDLTALDGFVDNQSRAKRDVFAVTEFGARNGFAGRVDADWYNDGLLNTLVDTGVVDNIAYAMTWTNRTDDQFWVPVPCFNAEGCPNLTGFDQRFVGSTEATAADWGFTDFIANPHTTLQRDLPEWWRMPEKRIEPYDPSPPPDHPGWMFPLHKPR